MAAPGGAAPDDTPAVPAQTLAGLFGRPYASWNVYPTWELEEAWRNALAAQHHDNHECEGLCGFVGHRQFWNSIAGAMEVVDRTSWLLSRRAGLRSAAGCCCRRSAATN